MAAMAKGKERPTKNLLSKKALLTPMTTTPLHVPTKAPATGLGQAIARSHKVLPGKGAIWNPHVQAELPTALAPSMWDDATLHAPTVEFCRWKHVSSLRSWFFKACRTHVTGLPILAFERWLIRAKHSESAATVRGASSSSTRAASDPILPCSSPSAVEPGLVADLQRASVPPEAATALARSMAERSYASALQVQHLQQSVARREAIAGAVEIIVHKHSFDVRLKLEAEPDDMTCESSSTRGASKSKKREAMAGIAVPGAVESGPQQLFKLNPTHWRKLCALFCLTRQRLEEKMMAQETKDEVTESQKNSIEQSDMYMECVDPASSSARARQFRRCVYCVLVRYHALQGPGFQAAVVEHGFEVLREHMGVTMECFASPLNCHFGRYCSAFADTDGVFGSTGSFFNFEPVRGSYEVNPPFIDTVMLSTVQHLHMLLQRSTRDQEALSFVVIVPGWQEDAAWKLCTTSSFLRAQWLISKEDHGFCDGAQHQRRDRYRASPFDTTVFVLQTDTGAAKWPATQNVEQAFRRAMAEGVPTPAMVARRLREGRGVADEDGAGGVYRGKPKQKKRQRQKGGGGSANPPQHTSAKTPDMSKTGSNSQKAKKKRKMHSK